jgi:hypothetical protein
MFYLFPDLNAGGGIVGATVVGCAVELAVVVVGCAVVVGAVVGAAVVGAVGYREYFSMKKYQTEGNVNLK